MLTKAQQMMVDDGFPPELFRSEKERAADWVICPPRPMGPSTVPRDGVRNVSGMRWDARRNKFLPDIHLVTSSQEDIEMPKWKITCFNEAGEVIERGSSSTPADIGQVELFAKMGAAYHRCADDTVCKVVVTDEAQAVVRQWEKGQNAEFPKPEPKAKAVKPAPRLEKDVKEETEDAAPTKTKKAKGGKSAAKKSAAKPVKQAGKKSSAATSGGIKKVGVIATIVETMKRPKGASVNEIVAALMKKFPDRDEKGMTSTARIQVNKHCSSKETDEKRGGTVYYAK